MDDVSFSPSETPPKKNSPSIFLNALQSVVAAAVVLATLFTMWTPANLFSVQILDRILQPLQGDEPVPAGVFPTPTPLPPLRVGIVAGHAGNDAGSVCPDGLREVDINTNIANLVKGQLESAGYQVDMLDEFDEDLYSYQAIALVSIHNDSCEYVNDEATGFKVAAARSSAFPEKAARLERCLIDRYHEITGMSYHANTITEDMTDYHTFREIHSETTAAIIETGFMHLDREILTREPDRIASGITAGIICYIRNEPLSPYVTSDEVVP